MKTSLAPGSKVVTEYYEKAGLTPYLEALGFNTVGYGCTTCIGNSGPLPDEVSAAVAEGDLVACAVLSGNRNFEARIHPEVKANYLASPPLVVAYALAGTDGHRHHDRAARARPGRRARLPRRHLAVARRGAGDDGGRDRARHVPRDLRRRLRGRGRLARAAGADRRAVRVGGRLDVRAPPAVLRRHGARRGHDRGHQRRALPRLDRRLRHDRPHLPRRLDQARLARGRLPRRARRRARRLQLVRLAARQPRGDGARHVRERPPAQPARPGIRGNVDGASPGRRGDDDLRGGRALPRRGRADDRARRQGVRLRLVARLGREGAEPARRAGRDRRELRADPPLEPADDGDPAACSTSPARTSPRSG